MRKCEYCGTPLPYGADQCPGCGARCEVVKDPAKITISERINAATDRISKKLSANGNRGNRAVMLLLVCLFFGMFGIHRFIEGKIATGLLWFFTGGLLCIGYIADAIYHARAVAKAFSDDENRQ